MKNGSFSGLDLPKRTLWSRIPLEATLVSRVHCPRTFGGLMSMVLHQLGALLMLLAQVTTKGHRIPLVCAVRWGHPDLHRPSCHQEPCWCKRPAVLSEAMMMSMSVLLLMAMSGSMILWQVGQDWGTYPMLPMKTICLSFVLPCVVMLTAMAHAATRVHIDLTGLYCHMGSFWCLGLCCCWRAMMSPRLCCNRVYVDINSPILPPKVKWCP